jgi:hypothetical protein
MLVILALFENFEAKRAKFFSKIRRDIFSSRCTTSVIDSGGKRKKSSIGKLLIIFLTPLGVELTNM